MPFKETCTITFCNYSNQTVTLKGSTGFLPTNGLKIHVFGCSWNEYKNVEPGKNGSPFDISFVEISGKGKYVGECYNNLQSNMVLVGEGDEKYGLIMIPFLHVSEPEPKIITDMPLADLSHLSSFICQPEGNGNIGKGITTNIRIRSLDAIPSSRPSI
jgi:hypothetical protein